MRRVLEDRFADCQAIEGFGQVEFAPLVREHGAAGRCNGCLADERLGEVHQPTVVRIGRVELHHGELGVMPRAHSFVAEIAVDLEHSIEATDDQTLEIELRCNAHVHFHVQRVVMRHERLGCRATRMGCSMGVSTSRKPASNMACRMPPTALLRASNVRRVVSVMMRST